MYLLSDQSKYVHASEQKHNVFHKQDGCWLVSTDFHMQDENKTYIMRAYHKEVQAG